MSKGQTSLLSGASGGSTTLRPSPFVASTRSATTITGSAWTKLVATPRAGRAAVFVWNASATFQLVGKMVAVGASAPTGSSVADGDFALAPRQSVLLELGDGFDLFALNDSGAGTGSTAVCNEVARS